MIGGATLIGFALIDDMRTSQSVAFIVMASLLFLLGVRHLRDKDADEARKRGAGDWILIGAVGILGGFAICGMALWGFASAGESQLLNVARLCFGALTIGGGAWLVHRGRIYLRRITD